jgi:hypothetical protein
MMYTCKIRVVLNCYPGEQEFVCSRTIGAPTEAQAWLYAQNLAHDMAVKFFCYVTPRDSFVEVEIHSTHGLVTKEEYILD